MTPVAEGLSGVVVDTDIAVGVVEMEDDVKVVKVLELELKLKLNIEVVKALVLVLEVDAVAEPIGKGVCTETVDEAVDKVTVADAAIGGGKAQYERVGSCP